MSDTSEQPRPLLAVDNLDWQVGERKILNRVCFQIQPGEFVGLIGPNGAGKSSLLRALYRKIIPTHGNIQLFGQSVDSYSRRQLAQKMSVVLQEPPSRFQLSVADVIRMGLTPHKKLLSFDTQSDLQRIAQAAKEVDLLSKMAQDFDSLSGGEKQRAMIARAMVQQPQLLLMDEPTNHLDIRHQLEVLRLARIMAPTVLVSIHDLNLAASFCDRLILLNDGEIVAQGEPAEVLSEENLLQVFAVEAKVDRHPFNGNLRITFNPQRASHG